MDYLLLIYNNEAEMAKMSEAERGAMYQEFMELNKSMQQAGNYHAGQQL